MNSEERESGLPRALSFSLNLHPLSVHPSIPSSPSLPLLPSQARIDAWNSDTLPIFEPGLDEVVKACRGRNLFFSTDTTTHVGGADIVFVSVNTPTKTRGVGAGKAADLTYWEGAARMIASVSSTPKIVVEKSTVPVKTAEAIEKVLTRNAPDRKSVV